MLLPFDIYTACNTVLSFLKLTLIFLKNILFAVSIDNLIKNNNEWNRIIREFKLEEGIENNFASIN